MCPKCWKRLDLCSGCSVEATRHPAIIYIVSSHSAPEPGPAPSTGYITFTTLATSTSTGPSASGCGSTMRIV